MIYKIFNSFISIVTVYQTFLNPLKGQEFQSVPQKEDFDKFDYVYCDTYDTITRYKNGMYHVLENNIWGDFKSDQHVLQCIFDTGLNRGYFWNIDGCIPSILSFPEIYTGQKPFQGTTLYDNNFLNKRIYEYNELNIYVVMDIIDYKGLFNTASETWLLDPNTGQVVSELLIFLDDYGVFPYGYYYDKLYDQYGNPWNIFISQRKEDQYETWNIISLQPDGYKWCNYMSDKHIRCEGTVDFKHFLYQLGNKGLVDLNYKINVIEIGNEVGGNCSWEEDFKGQGITIFRVLDFNIS